MEPFAQAHAAMRLMANETCVHYGPVAQTIGGTTVAPGCSRMVAGGYLLHSDSGYRYRYRQGHGVTIERPIDPDAAEEALWFNGSVYAAVASLNGLLPIHASAVAFEGRVYAFTGPSGAGKSTLVAALGQRGLAMFCDDTLVLDLSDPAQIICLPGHKRLKLTQHALALTGLVPQEKVGAMIDKYYASPPAGEVREPLPLKQLIFLEDGADFRTEVVTGARKFALMGDDHYTRELYGLGQRLNSTDGFAIQARLASQIAAHRLIRARGQADFGRSVTLAVNLITGA